MATYKLIQDIEAEDHILGPLTLRQFIFVLIALFCVYLSYISVAKGAAFLLVLFVPFALFFGFFAIPFGGDQPTEVWALAKIRFFLKPRVRMWDQSGVKDLVTITVPKKVERILTKSLSSNEVQSRLKTLANTLDSRGWATKDVFLDTNNQAYASRVADLDSDRLIDVDTLPKAVPDETTPAVVDVLDDETGPVAKHFEDMIDRSSRAYKQELMDKMRSAASKQSSPSQWFMPKSATSAPLKSNPANTVISNEDEVALAEKLRVSQRTRTAPYGHMRTLNPASGARATTQLSVSPSATSATSALTDQPDPAILSLANNNDFSVATIARQAKKAKGDLDSDEVVISLH